MSQAGCICCCHPPGPPAHSFGFTVQSQDSHQLLHVPQAACICCVWAKNSVHELLEHYRIPEQPQRKGSKGGLPIHSLSNPVSIKSKPQLIDWAGCQYEALSIHHIFDTTWGVKSLSWNTHLLLLDYIFVFGQIIGFTVYHHPWGCLSVVVYVTSVIREQEEHVGNFPLQPGNLYKLGQWEVVPTRVLAPWNNKGSLGSGNRSRGNWPPFPYKRDRREWGEMALRRRRAKCSSDAGYWHWTYFAIPSGIQATNCSSTTRSITISTGILELLSECKLTADVLKHQWM